MGELHVRLAGFADAAALAGRVALVGVADGEHLPDDDTMGLLGWFGTSAGPR